MKKWLQENKDYILEPYGKDQMMVKLLRHPFEGVCFLYDDVWVDEGKIGFNYSFVDLNGNNENELKEDSHFEFVISELLVDIVLSDE